MLLKPKMQHLAADYVFRKQQKPKPVKQWLVEFYGPDGETALIQAPDIRVARAQAFQRWGDMVKNVRLNKGK